MREDRFCLDRHEHSGHRLKTNAFPGPRAPTIPHCPWYKAPCQHNAVILGYQRVTSPAPPPQRASGSHHGSTATRLGYKPQGLFMLMTLFRGRGAVVVSLMGAHFFISPSLSSPIFISLLYYPLKGCLQNNSFITLFLHFLSFFSG